ncbi:MAG TPA: outer membrane protein assembly factor BamD [Candidatus Acidoferrales bacterium]|jgi:outer membrane protein assembly factor BamD|nr:outer membrane protein assembly factor BamD [Candidatus Acidoferrales bacterium]
MGLFLMNNRHLLIAGFVFSLAGSMCPTAISQKKPHITKVKPAPAAKKDDTTQSAEPDKVLYDKAMVAIKHSRYTEGRLDFQTLINTYPDSEYLAKAKLGVADSFYKEGGTTSLTQAIEEYKNFIVFFPFLDEAAYAQMQVGMAHYKLMEKADRDNSHGEAAEDEFRAFLLKYPQSPFVPQAEQSLRNVQEILAEGEFGIARFYYVKKDFRASAARLVEVTGRYPLFSESDEALWMLGDVYQRAKQVSKNEDDKNHWADLAAKCYDRIVQDYPSSSLVGNAKERLKSMNMPIPAPSPDAVQRMKQQQLYMKQHHEMAALKLPLGMIKSGPDFSAAAHSGSPNLSPPDDTVSAMEVLREGAAGPSFSVRAVGADAPASKAGTADSESVETDTPDASTPAAADAPTAATGVQILEAPNSGGATTAAPAAADPPAPAAAPAGPSESSSSRANPPSEPAATTDSATPNSSPASAPEGAAGATGTSATPQAQTASSQASPAAQTAGSAKTTPATADKADPSTESTSKKKKGLHKLIPF